MITKTQTIDYSSANAVSAEIARLHKILRAKDVIGKIAYRGHQITVGKDAKLRQLARIVEYATEGLASGDSHKAVLHLLSLSGLSRDLADDLWERGEMSR